MSSTGKFFTIYSITFLIAFAANAQQQPARHSVSNTAMVGGWQDNIKDHSNFYNIRKAYLDFTAQEKKENKISDDDEDAKFRRWEYFMEPRVYPSGKIPARNILLKELNLYKKTHRQKSIASPGRS